MDLSTRFFRFGKIFQFVGIFVEGGKIADVVRLEHPAQVKIRLRYHELVNVGGTLRRSGHAATTVTPHANTFLKPRRHLKRRAVLTDLFDKNGYVSCGKRPIEKVANISIGGSHWTINDAEGAVIHMAKRVPDPIKNDAARMLAKSIDYDQAGNGSGDGLGENGFSHPSLGNEKRRQGEFRNHLIMERPA